MERGGKGKSDVFWVYYVSGVTDALAAATATHRCDCDLASRARAAPPRLRRSVICTFALLHSVIYTSPGVFNDSGLSFRCLKLRLIPGINVTKYIFYAGPGGFLAAL